jgi:hypothetical protein
VAPLDRGAQRALPLGGVALAAGKQRQALLQALEERRGRQDLHARSGKLDRQRQIVEPLADGGYLAVGHEVALDGHGAREEQLDCVVAPERIHRVLVLAADAERLPAGGDELQVGALPQQLAELRRGGHEVLEVVEQHDEAAVTDVLAKVAGRAKRGGRRLDHQRGVTQRSERDPPHTAREGVGRLGHGL